MPGPSQLPHGQPRALQQRARLAGEHPHCAAPAQLGHDAERRALAAGGQRARVAVGEDPLRAREQVGAVAAIAPLAASSSAWIASASARAAAAGVASRPRSTAARTRSTAHARFTAVGRAPRSTSRAGLAKPGPGGVRAASMASP